MSLLEEYKAIMEPESQRQRVGHARRMSTNNTPPEQRAVRTSRQDGAHGERSFTSERMRIRENTSREQHERAGGLIQLHEERSSNIAYTCIYTLSSCLFIIKNAFSLLFSASVVYSRGLQLDSEKLTNPSFRGICRRPSRNRYILLRSTQCSRLE